ncbi:hypothetical protein CC86DRAFT_439615 [Ophiobolus disseminans]|uniref:Uncharacterized protein n=1 Tax=Ophiobolus disseminans TaxID=1469910 RepID=A0A6A7A1L2_9PLEO|nr:hypothetical protein CC86DRAFT_439615 [Ophiobolus disseminans]
MQDGFEMIAKIPYHIAQPSFYATASEAATLTFLQAQGISVPEVYSYSATANNPVGTEYILMAKAPGVSLASKWESLDDRDIKRIAKSFVELETKLFKLRFSTFGSLYFKTDIAPSSQVPLYAEENAIEADRFCIGPIADYMFWYGRRAGLHMNRGPWKKHVEYLQSIAKKEMGWTRLYGTAMEPDFPHNASGVGVQQPGDFLKFLESYQSLTPHLLPKSSAHPFNQPTLRHPDLTPGNIFITPETGQISCLIDWQHAIVQPQLLAAGYPRAFENPDDLLPPKLVIPKLPEHLSSLSPEEQTATRELHRQRLFFYTYRVLNGHFNQAHIEALRDPLLLGRQMLVDRAGRQWEGNFITLKGAVIRMAQFWEHLPDVQGIECPLRFDRFESEAFADIEDTWLKMSFTVEQWRQTVCGMSEEGWVRNEDYEESKQKLADLEEEIRLQCKGDEEDTRAFQTGWPFCDREEVY